MKTKTLSDYYFRGIWIVEKCNSERHSRLEDGTLMKQTDCNCGRYGEPLQEA